MRMRHRLSLCLCLCMSVSQVSPVVSLVRSLSSHVSSLWSHCPARRVISLAAHPSLFGPLAGPPVCLICIWLRCQGWWPPGAPGLRRGLAAPATLEHVAVSLARTHSASRSSHIVAVAPEELGFGGWLLGRHLAVCTGGKEDSSGQQQRNEPGAQTRWGGGEVWARRGAQ